MVSLAFQLAKQKTCLSSIIHLTVECLFVYARCLAQRSAFNFTQADIAVFRKHMVMELLYKTIL